MGAGASTESDIETVKASILEKLKNVKESHPNNLTAKYLNEDFINTLSEEDQRVLYRCTISGLENPDSQLGCYAMTPKDYETFKEFFDQVIRSYHADSSGEKTHITNWKLPEEANVESSAPKTVYDLSTLGLSDVSMRIRVGRNLAGYNLPGMMNKEERISFEQKLLPLFDNFIKDDNLKGQVFSLTPDFNVGEETKENPNLINDEKYNELVEQHLMFKNMDTDSYLKVAGIASDWPYGRGCYISENKDFIVWYGEEDQLRIMCMEKGTDLGGVFDKLHNHLDRMTAMEGIDFAKSDTYGFITSCPSNLGTGMRASVHVKIPNLVKNCGLAKIKEKCAELNLSVRGLGGEHTDIGEDGTIDLSPKARLFVSEAEIVKALYEGVKMLVEKENEDNLSCKTVDNSEGAVTASA